MPLSNHKSLTEIETYSLVGQYQLPVIEHTLARTLKEVESADALLDYPLVCKVVSPDVLHKASVGGVHLGITNRKQLISAYREIKSEVPRKVHNASIHGCIIAKQASSGLAEAIVGGIRDIEFGPSVMFGVGGEFSEILRCVVFRPAPITKESSRGMVIELMKRMQKHTGWQSIKPSVLASVILKIGDLLLEHPEIESIDLNPIIIYKDSCVIVDAKAIKLNSN